ncbi:MAG: nucleoside hydrolase [Egibacteraceae bacterium]
MIAQPLHPARRMVVGTDTASDDAVALLLAAAAADTTIEAVTVVAGNVPVDRGVANALATLELAGAGDVPVHPGCDRPLLRELTTAEHVHGADGMGGHAPPPAVRAPEREHAVDALIRLSHERPGGLTLVTLGPLTNVATALSRDPAMAKRYAAVYVMGGAADGVGNVSAVAEFNIWADPEAAAMVFASGLPLVMVGWDVSRRYAVMRPADQDRLAALGTARARFTHRINATLARFCATITKLEGYDLPDPVTMAIAIDPGLILRSEELGVTVDTSFTRMRGMTVVDRLGIEGIAPNVTVVWDVDEDRFKQQLMDACAADGGAAEAPGP